MGRLLVVQCFLLNFISYFTLINPHYFTFYFSQINKLLNYMDIYHDIHHFLEIYEHIFFMGKLLIYSSIVKEVQKYENKINDIQVY
jgi:hypothetical protein